MYTLHGDGLRFLTIWRLFPKFCRMTFMTIQLTFTPEIQEELNYQRYHHPVPMVQRRMEVRRSLNPA